MRLHANYAIGVKINGAMSNLKMKVFLDLFGIVFLLTSNVHHGKVSHPAVDM